MPELKNESCTTPPLLFLGGDDWRLRQSGVVGSHRARSSFWFTHYLRGRDTERAQLSHGGVPRFQVWHTFMASCPKMKIAQVSKN